MDWDWDLRSEFVIRFGLGSGLGMESGLEIRIGDRNLRIGIGN